MISLHNILTVALYEAKTLRRSWLFRIFSTGAILLLILFNIRYFSPLGNESWLMISISSSIPYINLYLLNIGQSIIVIFLASDFIKKDKKLDTNEVLYARSMSNLEYVLGKTWGILRLFLGLNLVVLTIGLLVNLISKRISIDFLAYISYPLLISVPTLVFSLGLAFLLMSVVRNQAITFLILLGIAGLDIFYMWFRMDYLFDYMAFGLPLFKSGLIGFDNLNAIIVQRLLYLLLGLALVLATALLFNRLPQSKLHRILSVVFLILFVVGAATCSYNIYRDYNAEINDKNLVIETNRLFENRNFPCLRDASITFIHKGKSFEAFSTIVLTNDNKEPLEQYILSLNPSLNVLEITRSSESLNFIRTNHIIEIDPGKNLYPGQTDSIMIHYEGEINESFCYPDSRDRPKDNPYLLALVNLNKRQAFLKNDFVLLTPETHWYPVAALNYYPSNPAQIKLDFTHFHLNVKTEDGLTAVSQGKMISSEGYTTFNAEEPLTGLTLVIGNYQSDVLKVDSVEYISYHFPGNDYYKRELIELKDTLPNLLSGIMRELEINFSASYPFKTLSLAEIPVQFYSYPKKNMLTRAEVQPSMILLPERLSTLGYAGFAGRFTREKKRQAQNNEVLSDKEIQLRMFNDFVRYNFISGENLSFINGVPSRELPKYFLGPGFYLYRNNFYSSEYPVINAVFESYLQQIEQEASEDDFMTWYGAISDMDKANLVLKEYSFKDLLAKNPAGDTIRNVLTMKGNWFFNLLQSEVGIDEFRTWLASYLAANTFKNIDILQFNMDFKGKFGFDFYPYLNQWYMGKHQPGFLFNNIQVEEIIIDDRTKYQVTFIASNPEPVAGLFNISFRMGDTGSGGDNTLTYMIGGRNKEEVSRIIHLGPNEAKRIGIILDAQPRDLMINTLVAKNIPGEITIPITEIIKTKSKTRRFSGEEIISSAPSFSDPGEIIVDNEDQGFMSSKKADVSPLKEFLGVNNNIGVTYKEVIAPGWYIPEYWQPVIENFYYGKYIRSSLYTRGGTGERSVSWTALITEPGNYDVYCYIGKNTAARGVIGGGAGQGVDGTTTEGQKKDTRYKDMHYSIYHDDGIEEITVDYSKAEGGWNSLGKYYFSQDSAKVVLTNKSEGRIVIGDAIKWVKQN